MTEALWLTLAGAVVASFVLATGSLFWSRRSAARIDEMVARREAEKRARAETEAEADRLMRENLIRTR